MSWGRPGSMDFNAPPYNAPPGFSGRIAGPNELPDLGGFWEYPNFGGPAIWHPTKPGAAPNNDTFNPEYGNSNPYESEVEDEGGLTGAFTKYTVWGRLLNLVDRWQKR